MTAAPGILFFVVGPSGSGKDTLIDGARAALGASGRYTFGRRAITRPSGAAGEDHEGLDPDAFAEREREGGFLITWEAHGLHYGLPASIRDELTSGRHVVANGSRAVVVEIARRVTRLVVVEIWAPESVLAARIQGRGRESGSAVAARVGRRVTDWAPGQAVLRVANDTTVEAGIERFVTAIETVGSRFRLRRVAIETGERHLAFLPRDSTVVRAPDYLGPGRIEIDDGTDAIRAEVALAEPGTLLAPGEIGLTRSAFAALGRPEGALVAIRRTPSPASRDALRRKIAGRELGEDEYETVVRDIAAGRYTDAEVAGFLVAANTRLSDDEVLALARVRSRHANPLRWDERIVVDKHSMGGIPGSRITLVVVPLVTAHGLMMPKTSSRAITSAAGTADAMETLARVDLTAEEVRATVGRARGCIAWNGRLSHSPLDDVMNAITRPLGLDSARWSVASILSKKQAAGSTHVVLDLPWGPGARMRDATEAAELARLFEYVGAGLGLKVRAFPTDGTAPIGRGIGPALEVRDVLAVLDNAPGAPADLREKALAFASRIIAWDASVGGESAARRRAEELLASGAARQALDAIVDAQGRQAVPARPAALTRAILADRSGPVTRIDGFAIGGIARRAGAPFDKGAGVDLQAALGAEVRAGDPLFVIHAGEASELETAAALATRFSGFVIGHTASHVAT